MDDFLDVQHLRRHAVGYRFRLLHLVRFHALCSWNHQNFARYDCLYAALAESSSSSLTDTNAQDTRRARAPRAAHLRILEEEGSSVHVVSENTLLPDRNMCYTSTKPLVHCLRIRTASIACFIRISARFSLLFAMLVHYTFTNVLACNAGA